MTLEIRPARPGEEGLVLGFIAKLADYEKLSHEVTASEADMREGLLASGAEMRALNGAERRSATVLRRHRL